MIGLSVDMKAPVTSISSKSVVSSGPSMSIEEMAEYMMDSGYRRIPVIDRGRLQGVVSSIDILRHLASGKDVRRPVSTIMTGNVLTIERSATIEGALAVMREHRKGSYPVVSGLSVVGIVSDVDIIRNIPGPVGIEVGEAMTHKPVIAKDHYIMSEAAKILVMGGYRRLPVIDSKKQLVGVLTPFDIINFLIKKGRLSGLPEERTPVSSIMAKNVITVRPDIDIYHAVRTILGKSVGGLPVVDDSGMVGIITENDIVRLV